MMQSDADIKAQRAERKGQSEKLLYPVLCAWCEKEGVRTVVRWVEYPHSHGICEMHAEEVRREIEEFRMIRLEIKKDRGR